MCNNVKKIKGGSIMSKINVVHAFSGVDSQLMAEKRVWGDRVQVLATIEVDADAIISCGAIHENEKFVSMSDKEFTPDQIEFAKNWLKERNIGFDFEKGKSKIDRMKKDKLKQLYIASRITKNLGDISLANKIKLDEEVDIFTYSSPCFLKGTLVSTDRGLVCIEDIKKGDMVLTHNNVYKKVVTPMINKADHIYKFRCMASEDLYVTGEHPFYVRERYWGTNGDRYTSIPKDMKQGKLKRVRMFKSPEFKKVSELNNNYYVGTPINNLSIPYKWDGCLVKSQWGHAPVVKNEISDMLDKEDFWWLVGRFLGDGWVDRWDVETGGIKICSADTKTKNVSDVEMVLNRLGISYVKTEERTSVKFTISKQEYKKFFKQFGRGAENKVIPQNVLNIPKHLLKSLLEGYWSADGCFDGDLYQATSVSRTLIVSLAQAIHKVYKKGTSVYKTKRKSTCVIEGRVVNQRDTYTVTFKMNNHKQSKCFEDDGYIWSPIKSIEKQEYLGDVYNFEVEEDNSYVVHNVIVHNCQSFSVAGKQEGLKGTSGLLLECEKFIEINKPKVLLLENVKNLVGKQFKQDFDNWCDILDKLGYNTYWKVLNAKHYGVAQNRERVFALSIRKDLDCGYEFPEGFPLETRLKDILEKEVESKYYLSDEVVSKFKAKFSSDNITDNKVLQVGNIVDTGNWDNPQRGRIYSKDGISPTLNCVGGGGLEPKILEKSTNNIIIAGEVPIANYNHLNKVYDKNGICCTLDTMQGGHRQPKILEESIVCEQRSDEGLRFFKDNVCGTLRTIDSCRDKRIVEPIIAASRGRNPENPSDRTVGAPTEQRLEFNPYGIANTLTTVQKDNYVVEPLLIKEATKKGYAEAYEGDSVNLEQPNSQTRRGRVGTQMANTLMTSCNQGVVDNFRIRKLTPRECWNLMNFDSDAFDKVRPFMSDSALYKQAGNSIVVACMEYIFKNLDIDKIKGE